MNKTVKSIGSIFLALVMLLGLLPGMGIVTFADGPDAGAGAGNSSGNGSNIEVTAFTVTWKNGETVIKTDSNVQSGTKPQYKGMPPTKAEDADFTYTYSGWTDGQETYAPGELPNVTGNVTYTAVFTAVPKYEAGYYIVGNMNDWSPDPRYQLALNTAATGVTEYIFENLSLTTSSQFKVVYAAPNASNPGGTRTWFPTLGDNFGQNGEIPAAGKYTLYFRPDYNGGSDWFCNCLLLKADPSSMVTFLGGGLRRRVSLSTGEVVDYQTDIRFGFEFDLPEGAVIDTTESYFRWSLYPAASATVGNKIDITNIDTSGSKPVAHMIITGIPKAYYSANITCFVHLVYKIGNDSFVIDTNGDGAYVRSVDLVCQGLVNAAGTQQVWKDYAQRLLDAIAAG